MTTENIPHDILSFLNEKGYRDFVQKSPSHFQMYDADRVCHDIQIQDGRAFILTIFGWEEATTCL